MCQLLATEVLVFRYVKCNRALRIICIAICPMLQKKKNVSPTGLLVDTSEETWIFSADSILLAGFCCDCGFVGPDPGCIREARPDPAVPCWPPGAWTKTAFPGHGWKKGFSCVSRARYFGSNLVGQDFCPKRSCFRGFDQKLNGIFHFFDSLHFSAALSCRNHRLHLPWRPSIACCDLGCLACFFYLDLGYDRIHSLHHRYYPRSKNPTDSAWLLVGGEHSWPQAL